jgi:hypothetical protein
LAEKRVGVVLADEIKQVPGAIGQDDPVDFGIVLYRIEKTIQSIRWAELG